MALARRLAVALAALIGLALTVLGAWFAVILGPKGTATFTASSNQPAVLVGPQILNRVNVPVTVTAKAASGPVFLGAAVPQDAVEAIGQSGHNDAVSMQFPARTIDLVGFAGEPMPDPTSYHVWRATGDGTVTLSQESPSAVVVYATNGGPVDLTVSYARSAWFLQSLVALVVGLIVMAFAGGWLWQQFRGEPQREAGAVAEAPVVEPEPATTADMASEGEPTHTETAEQRPEEAR